MKCDVCNSEASVHGTTIRRGVRLSEHLCEAHARRLLAFISQNKRTPTTEESARLQLPAMTPASGDDADMHVSILRALLEHAKRPPT